MTQYKVATLDELLPGELLRVDAGAEQVCLARLLDGSVYAIADTCTHEDYPLSEGEIWGTAVQCPMHGSLFDLITGEVIGLPAEAPTRTFPVAIDDGAIAVIIE